MSNNCDRGISGSNVRAHSTYLVRVIDGGETLARQTGLLDARRRPVRGLPNRLTTGSREELAAVWRGAFLAHGSLTDPGRSSALEVSCPGNEAAMALVGAAGRLKISAKAREVRVSSPAIASASSTGPYMSPIPATPAMPMVPRPMAGTSRPCVPSLRKCILQVKQYHGVAWERVQP